MHPEIAKFCKQHASRISGDVLEVGSRNFNGTIRDVLPITVGVDMEPGDCVDRVCDVVDLISTFGPESFDCVVSCDALEHMQDWDASLVNMWGVLKPGGIFLLTMANPRKGRHGYPHDYHRMDLKDMEKVFAGNELLGSFIAGPSQGVCVIKSADIDLSIRPTPVK